MIYAVIGSNYGDEGKGLVTDYFSQPSTLVVKFNGGAQAGHTVITPEGLRCVFHQLGAGSFKGASTLLSRHFLVNPTLFVEEWKSFTAKTGLRPKVFIDPTARVTTPFDMLLNRAVEQSRGSARHGSCGLGINETVVRCESTSYGLHVVHLNSTFLQERLTAIAIGWLPRRAQQLGVVVQPFDVERYVTRAVEDIQFLLRHTEIVDDVMCMQDFEDDIVFEGAQGLRLDEQSPDFPHVTRSRTGLTNVVELLEDASLVRPLEVVYVTRSYVTRHGEGPLPAEQPKHPGGWVGPETNTTNDWQGKFRYGLLEPVSWMKNITDDMKAAHLTLAKPKIFITCLDQYPATKLVTWIGDPSLIWTSHGPTRADVIEPPPLLTRVRSWNRKGVTP